MPSPDFPRYSLNNSILIMLQKPDSSLVNSYTGWQKLGRNVRRGEKGIAIWAPMPVKVKSEQMKVDENGDAILQPDGTPAKEVKEFKAIRGFRIEHTFDISQTEIIPGKNAPDLNVVTELNGSYEDYDSLMKAICNASPVPISMEDIKDGSRGYFSPTENRIAVKEGLSQESSIEVVCHELGHACMHSLEQKKFREEKGLPPLSTSEKELEAESVSYIVSSHYGINTSSYSFPYVGTWLTGYNKNVKAEEVSKTVRQHLQTIQTTASDLITKIDKQLELQHSEKIHMDKQSAFHQDARNIAEEISSFVKRYNPASFRQHELYEGAYAEQTFRHLKNGDSGKYAAAFEKMVASPDCKECHEEAQSLAEKINQFEESQTRKKTWSR